METRKLFAVLQVGSGLAFTKIQEAVEHARWDDVVEVAPGVYNERIDWSRMGIAVSSVPGNLNLRGTDRGVIVRSPGGPAIFNSAPITADLAIQELTLEAATPGSAILASGVVLHEVSGRILIKDTIFQNIPDHGIELLDISGQFMLVDNLFTRIGNSDGDAAIRLREVSGIGVLRDNTFDEVADRGVSLVNDEANLVLMLDDNSVHGDGVHHSTTDVGFDIRLSSATSTDVSWVNNQVDGVAKAAILLSVSDVAQLQMRLTENHFANIRGPWGVQMELHDHASVGLSGQKNSLRDLFQGGWRIDQQDAAKLNGTVVDNLFQQVGLDAGDRALVLASSSSGERNVRVHRNEFEEVAGDGLVISSGGSGATHAIVTDNTFTEIAKGSGSSSLAAFQAANAGAGHFHLRLTSNIVSNSGRQAFVLNRTAGSFSLEGTLADAAAQVSADNIGTPNAVSDSIVFVPPGSLAPFTPVVVGDAVWFETSGNSVQDLDDLEVADVKLSLLGKETATGATVQRETLTDGRGTYFFSGLLPGEYTITITLPLGRGLVFPHQGPHPLFDSDFDRKTRSVVVEVLGTNDLSVDAGLWGTWQNPVNRLDVDADAIVAPRDVLLIINDLNLRGARELPEPFPDADPRRFFDVDGNGFISPLDVLLVINYLNRLAGI